MQPFLSASVGFPAAAGTTRVNLNPCHIVPGPSWNSGNQGSQNLIPPPTPLSAGPLGNRTLPVSRPVSLPSSPPSDTAPPVRSPARVSAGPRTPTPLPPRLQCTSQKRGLPPSTGSRIGKARPGPVSTPTEPRSLPHSSLKDYNSVSSNRPGSVYGLRVVF